VTNTSVTDLQTQGNKISKILLSNGQVVPIEELIICTGSWSPFLLKKLGMRLLLQDGKGYSFTLKNQKLRPKIPTILTESKVAVTPMGNDLRIGGTLELGGMSTKINTNRLQGIFESLPKYYPDLKISKPDLQSVWMGYRPCTPDGLPYIGRSVAYQNLIIGTGHGMMGMSMGPATGQFLSQIVNGEKPTLDISLCKVDRW
jgi:D-amino-acid dehydrogenase